LQADR